MFTYKKKLLRELLTSKEYLDNLNIVNTLLETGQYKTEENFTYLKRKNINFILYMYGYKLNVNTQNKGVFTISKIEEYKYKEYNGTNRIDKLNDFLNHRKEVSWVEQTISCDICSGILSSDEGVFIKSDSNLYKKINLNILTYIDLYLSERGLYLITYETNDGIYLKCMYLEDIIKKRLKSN